MMNPFAEINKLEKELEDARNDITSYMHEVYKFVELLYDLHEERYVTDAPNHIYNTIDNLLEKHSGTVNDIILDRTPQQ